MADSHDEWLELNEDYVLFTLPDVVWTEEQAKQFQVVYDAMISGELISNPIIFVSDGSRH